MTLVRLQAKDSETTSDDRVEQGLFIVEPNREPLIRLGDLLDAGDFQPVVDAVVPLGRGTRDPVVSPSG